MANLRKVSISPVEQSHDEEISAELIKEAFYDCFEFAVSSAVREHNGDWTVSFVKLISQKDFQRISEESLFISGLEFTVKEVPEIVSEADEPTNSPLEIPEVHGVPEHVIFIRATKKNDTSNYTYFQKNEIAFSRRLANAFRAKVSFCSDVRREGGGCFGCDSEEDLGILKAQFASGKPVEFVLQSIKYVCTEVDKSSLPTTPQHHQAPSRKQSLLTPLGPSAMSMSVDGGDSPFKSQRLNSTVDRTNLANAFADGSIPEAITNMPVCAERSLLLLSHHFSVLAAAAANPLKGSVRLDGGHLSAGVLSKWQVRDFLKLLDDQIAAENLYTRALMDTLAHVTVLLDQQDRESAAEREAAELGTLSTHSSDQNLHAMSADDFLPVAPKQRSISQSINAQISRHLIKCISEIRVIDTDLLVRLLQNTLNAAASIAGKDVILLLGNTGAGKSTTIHFLGGSEMKMGEDPINGFDHIEIMHNEPQLDTFVTSSKLTSETLYINAIDLQLGDISFTLCDTPGFGDNRGIEIDIANGLGIANAVRRCHSVRPLFLISLPSAGDRFDLVVKLLKTPIEFIAPVEDYMQTFSYWFTKYPLAQYKHTDKLYKIVNSKFEDLESSEADESVIYIFQDMLYKIEQRDYQAVVLDPCNDDPMEMLKELLSTPAIENPGEAFQNFATPENLSKVKVQLAKHNSSVENALKRQDYELVAYKLSQVAILRESLLLQESVKAHEDCVRKVSSAAAALLSSVLGMLDKCALTSIPTLSADLELCKGELLQLLYLECIRSAHFSEVVSYKSSCASKIISTQRVFHTSVMEFCKTYKDAVQGGGTTDRRNVVLHQRCAACLNTLNKMTEVVGVFNDQFHASADEILPGGLDSEEERVVSTVVGLLNEGTTTLKGVVAMLVNDFDECAAKLDVTGALCQLLGVKYLSEVLGTFACEPSVYETRKGMFTQVVQMVFTQAKDLLFSSKKLKEYTTADYQCIHLASRVTHELSPAVSDTVLRQIFPSETCAVMQKYFTTLMDRVKSLVNHCATGVKETLAADPSATAYTPVAAAVERILLLRGCKETENAIIDEFNELVLAVCNCTSGLREDLNRTVTLLSSGSWFIDCDDFIAKLDKLQGALCLKEVGDPGIFYSGEYEQVSEQLREAFVAIMGQIHETVLSYDAPEVLQRFVQPMKILAQFSQLFRHQIELDIDEEGKADIIKPLPTVRELTSKHAITQNVNCTSCKQILSDWRPFAKKNCKVCYTRVHRWCSKKVTLNGNFLRQCYLCRDNHAREVALGASDDRATLVLGDVEGHDLDVLELTPPKSHHEQFLPPPPPTPEPKVNIFTKIKRVFHQQPPPPPPAPVNIASPSRNVRRGYAAAPGLPASMEHNRTRSAAPSVNQAQSLRDKLNFNARDSMDFEAIQIGATSSIADIATRIILEFRGKVKKELVVARGLFPPPHSFDPNYRLEYAKAWSAIQFLKNAEIFSFPEVNALDESVRAFSNHHFKALQQTLLSAFNVATSEDVNESVNQDKAKAVGEMQEVFSYLNYAVEYYQRHKSETLGTDDAVDMIADAAKDLHIILFLHSSEQINDWWLNGPTAKLNRHIQSLMNACTAETEFESLNMKLFTARSLSLLDTLLDEATQRYNDAAVALEDLIRSINNDVSFEIKSERYDVVAKFFEGKSLDTEAEREINRAVLDELTASLEVKVAAAQDKVRVMTLSVTNQSVTAALSKDLIVLRSAAQHVCGILNEPLRGTLKKDIYEIEFDLLMRTKEFLDTVDEQVPALALHYVEEVLQIVANLMTVFFGSSEAFDEYSKDNNLVGKGIVIDIESKRKAIKKHVYELTCTFRTAFQDAVALCVVAESVAGGDDGVVDVNAAPDSNFVNTFGFAMETSHLGSVSTPAQRPAPARQISLKREHFAPGPTSPSGEKVNPLDALVTLLTDIVPIKIVDALSAASKAGSGMFYIEQEDAFTSFLAQMFEQLLAVAADSKHPTDLRERVLSTVEKCIQVLPQAIVGKINTQLHECNQSLRYERENFKVEMAENSEIADLKVLMNRYRNYYKRSNFQNSYDMQLLLSKKIRSAISAYLSELAADNLVAVLEKLPPAWEEWLGYFDFCERLHRNSVYSRQVYRINRHHIIKDTESLDAVMQLCKKLYPAVRRFVQELKKVDKTDPTAFTVFSTHFDVFVRLMLAKYSSLSMFTALERSYTDMNGLEYQLQTILTNVAGAFKHYSSAIEKATAESGWPPIVASLLDLFQASDPLWPKLTGFISQHAALAEFSSIAAFIKTCKSYSATKQMLVDNLRATAAALKITFLHNPHVMTKNGMDRDAFYAPFCAKYGNILCASALQYHFSKSLLDIDELVTQCRDSVTGELQKIRNFVLELITSSIPGPRAESYEEFNIWYDNLRAFRDAANKENSNAAAQAATTMMKEIDAQMSKKLDIVKRQADGTKEDSKLIVLLAQMKQISINVPLFKQSIDTHIDSVLHNIKANNNLQRIIDISLALTKATKDETMGPVYQMILSDHSAFQGLSVSLFNDRIAKFSINECLDEKNGLSSDPVNDLNRDKLRTYYEQFKVEYQKVVEDGLVDVPAAIETIKANVKTLTKGGSSAGNAGRVDKILKMMVNLFAYWTLSNSQYYSDMSNMTTESGDKPGEAASKDNQRFLLQPHAGQITSLFRIFGFDDRTQDIRNHLIQIGTGEGKSIILAISSAVFALLGFTVHCACYSEYLSRRDYNAFSKMFTEFGISEFIMYGTFTELCEQFIEDLAGGDIRTSVESMIGIKSNAASSKRPPSKRQKVLLIDEVDVFFSPDFYGNTYRPFAKIEDPTVSALIDKVWSERNPLPPFSQLQQTKEYQACLRRFPGFDSLIAESVKTMFHDLKDLDEHKKLYKVLDDKIGYKDQDKISFNISYGYKTLFAYYKENRDGHISTASLASKKYMTIDCGAISFAEVPKMYTYRLGVSGTLRTLSDRQKELLRTEYTIHKYTFTPSVYGTSRQDYAPDRDIVLEPQNGHWSAITNEVVSRSKTGGGVARPVLVFFKTAEELLKYYKSNAPGALKHNMKYMTEEVSAADKDSIIRQATSPGSVTILSREFGRGTDFIIYDDRVSEAGGVHVVQTFLSEEVSEETQIKGRSARQGCKGSYSMVLSYSDLEKFTILETGPQSIETMKMSGAYMGTISAKRTAKVNQVWGGTQMSVQQIGKEHKEAMEFLTTLIANPSSPLLRTHLFKQNKSSYVEAIAKSRTVILMDATGSMASLLTNAKNAVKTMFERANEIIDKTKKGATFDVQFVAYRNYNAPEDALLMSSSWENSAMNLFTFMDTVTPDWGWGPEAVEVGFWHVNEEIRKDPLKGVSQVILIADQPPNSDSDVNYKRADRGESYWSGTRFSKPVYCNTELRKMIDKKVKVHAFYVADAAKSAFQDIAKRSGGECEYLDLNSNPAGAANILTNMVTVKILSDLGGDECGAQMVAEYKKTFGYVK